MEHLFATYVRKIHIMERLFAADVRKIHIYTYKWNVWWNVPKENKPVKQVKEHGRSGFQSKFLDAALKKKCQTQVKLAYTND